MGVVPFGWPPGYELPGEEELVADAHRMLAMMRPLELDTLRPLSPHVTRTLSPVWVENDGEACMKVATMPTPARARFWTAGPLLAREEIATLPAKNLWIFAEHLGDTALALEDTVGFWWDARAPLRRLDMPWQGHFGLLSALLADLVRKASAGFDTLEWYASLGVPLELVLEPSDPTIAQVKDSMREQTEAMWAEEDLWRMEAGD